MINAEYEELDNEGGELDLADTDNLPWLEADDEDEAAGGIDTGQIMLFAAGLLVLLAAVVSGVWWLSNRAAGTETVADGSVIEAPAGPIKQRPDEPGGKEFAGTGNVAPVVGEGGSRPAVVADAPVSAPASAPAPAATKPESAAGQAAATGGVGVQLAAYGTRARAEQGWSDISRRTDALAGVKYRVVEGKVDIGTVYRLQAVAGNRAEADKLCAALKADGVDCQVK
ncbi:MAG: SPOR domain-containing protein [Sphingomonadales bacterium]|nr:MAG: SPOR domain-containing protein [Sphingomonadales bacterium]